MLSLQMSKSRKYLFITCHPSYASRIRRLPCDVEFSYEQKRWITGAENLGLIQEAFEGEIYYKTPKWFIDGYEEEPVKEISFFEDPVDVGEYKIAPYDYQVRGAQFMIDRINHMGFCLNSDGVGSGKTFQALMATGYFLKKKEVSHILLICKKSIKNQWAREIEKFTDWKLPVYVTGDTKKKRTHAYEAAMESKKCVLITNYHNFLNDYAEINATPWDLVILDEAHSVKRADTKMNTLIGHTMRGKRCIFLTATPVLSTPEDIFGIVNMASFTYFGSKKNFENKYLVIEYGKYGRQVIGARNLDELNNSVSDFMIRRSEKEISVELPSIVEEPVRVAMDQTQEKLLSYIDERIEQIDAQIEKVMGGDHKDPETIREKVEEINERKKMYISAKQFASDDPRAILMLDDGYVSKPLKKLVPEKYPGSEKTEAAVDVVESVVSAGEKIIVFCHYSTTARLLKEELEKSLKIPVCIYTGDESTEERDKAISLFTEKGSYNVLIGTDSMAEGLNLQAAKYQIHFEQAETFAMRNQRIGRSRRIGSEFGHVVIYDLITEGSFDEARINKIARDREITGAVLG